MTAGGYQIGVKEVYDAVNALSAKFDTMTNQHQEQIAANTARLETQGRALQMMWNKLDTLEKEGRQQSKEFDDKLNERHQFQWQTGLAIVSAIIALASVLGQFIIK